jgi:hypothetical protein
VGVAKQSPAFFLPLARDDDVPALVLVTRVSFPGRIWAEEGEHLKGAIGTVRGTFPVHSLEELEGLATAWETAAVRSQTPVESPRVGHVWVGSKPYFYTI